MKLKRVIAIFILIGIAVGIGIAVSNAHEEEKRHWYYVGLAQGRATAKPEVVTITEYRTVKSYVYLPREKTEEDEPSNSLGIFTTTAYCSCEQCCGPDGGKETATGTTPTAGHTIAVDPSVIPYGSQVIIDGQTYTAEDCGGAVQGNRIDIYCSSHAEALQYGVQSHEVYLVD